MTNSGLPNIPKGAYLVSWPKSGKSPRMKSKWEAALHGSTTTLVAMSDQSAALSALRKRPGLRDIDLTVVGEASPNDVEWLDLKDGEIFCVIPIFETRFSK